MMKCPACGARYSAAERLCPKDGSVLEPERSFEEQFIGKTLDGKYRLDSFISRGGMGAVFRGTHVMLNRPVAVKMINAELVTSPEIVRRFQREARAATQLNHANVVDVYDLGQTSDGTLYIVMELVIGKSLKEEIRMRGALDAARIVHILSQVCEGLGVAHKANIIHRDLKPQNIMLTHDRAGAEVAKIVDFGIAKTFEVDTHTQLTADGSTLGTPHYMSPEQATGREIDGRSDIYSLGIILYEMLTGEVPFDDQSLPAVLIKHMSEPPVPPSQRRPDLRVSPALEAIALRCLAKDPAARYATAEEMAAALRAAHAAAAGDATIPLRTAPSDAATVPSSPVSPPTAPAPPTAPPAVAAAPTIPLAPTAPSATPASAADAPSRPATHPTAPVVPPPLPASPPALPSAPLASSASSVTTRSSRGPAVLVAAFVLLLGVSAIAGYLMWSRDRAVEPETSTTEGPAPSTSPAGGTPAASPAQAPALQQPTPSAESSPRTEATALPSVPSSTPTSAMPSRSATSSQTSAAAAARTVPRATAPGAAGPGAPSAPESTRAPSARSTPAPGATESAGALAPGAPSATLPENPTVSFQCRGPAEICNPLRNELQTAFDRAGISMRRGAADVNITAVVEQTDQTTQQAFGTTVTIRTYAVQLEAESPRFDNDTVAMPNAPPVSADARLGAERFSEYARRISPDIVERVRTFWTRRRQ